LREGLKSGGEHRDDGQRRHHSNATCIRHGVTSLTEKMEAKLMMILAALSERMPKQFANRPMLAGACRWRRRLLDRAMQVGQNANTG
jgi:phage-related protein